MKTILRIVCIITIMGAFAARGQDAPVAKEVDKVTIAKAKVAILKVAQ